MARLTFITAGGHETSAPLGELVTPAIRDAARAESGRWIKSLRFVPYGGRTMRERFTYRGDSLWWFTEIYLHKMRRLETAVALELALDEACGRLAPSRLRLDGGEAVVEEAVRASAAARRLPVECRGGTRPGRLARWWSGFQVGLSARLSRIRPAARPPAGPARVVAFVHTAFWRDTGDGDGPGEEGYIGPVLDAVARQAGRDALYLVGVGPRRNFAARRWWDPVRTGAGLPPVTPVERLAPAAALAGSQAIWRARHRLAAEIVSGEAVREAGRWRGVDFWPVLRGELADAAAVQWPWSARAMDEAGAALDALRPAVAVTYAEAGGWGRALVLEARRRGIASAGVQHGFIYRHWLNYRHEPDEMAPAGADAGFPRPDRTLLFDRGAEAFLRDAGRFPPGALVVTGSARFDDLAARVAARRAEAADLRRRAGARADQRLVLLAAKHAEVRAELPALAGAVAARPGVHLVVKPHPAETPGVYAAAFDGMVNVSVAAAGADLADLMAAADALVTMNSTVAIDGLVLGLPALVIGLPNNLTPFVEAGVMLGAAAPDAVGPALDALLYDEGLRRRLVDAAAAFADAQAMRADGGAAARAARAILALAGEPETREQR